MRFKETGFRAFYRNLTALMLTDKLRETIRGFPGAEEADCILTYGYIDHDAGLTLEILAAGKKRETGFQFFDGTDKHRACIRMKAVENADFFLFEDKERKLKARYGTKIDMLHQYDVSEEIEKTREMLFLDACRDPYCIDDVLVYLMGAGYQTEGCWVRINGLGKHWFVGKILNEPKQSFGLHQSDNLAFSLKETGKGVICLADLTPRKLTAEALADGTLLKATVSMFNIERTERRLLSVLEMLRDSLIWIPCNTVLGEQDQAFLDNLIKENKENPGSIVGQTFTSRNSIRLVPDILQSGDQYFFPVFSSEQEMGEYGKRFSKVQKHFLEAIPMARNNEKGVAGIVLNAFTEPFVLDKKLFDLVEKMESQLG